MRKRPPTNLALESVVKAIRNGDSMTRASLEAHVSPRRVKKYLADQRIGKKVKGRWVIKSDPRLRTIVLFSEGQKVDVTVRGLPSSKRIGKYLNAVKKFLDSNDPRHLIPFTNKGVTDVSGIKHIFEIDPNTLYRLTLSEGDDFSMIYRIH